MLKRRSLGFKTPAYERIPILNDDLQSFDDQNMALELPLITSECLKGRAL